jgi:hypothetical protein
MPFLRSISISCLVSFFSFLQGTFAFLKSINIIIIIITRFDEVVQVDFLEMAAHEDSLVQAEFLGGSLEHLRLVGVLCHKSVDSHLLRLAYPMRSCRSLHIILWVPIAIVDHHDLRSSQIYPLSASLRRKQKHLPILRWVIEPVDCILSLPGLNLTVYLLVFYRLYQYNIILLYISSSPPAKQASK